MFRTPHRRDEAKRIAVEPESSTGIRRHEMKLGYSCFTLATIAAASMP